MRRTILTLTLLAMCVPAPAQTNLLVNPGFNLPAGTPCGPSTGYREATHPTGWNASNWSVAFRWVGKNEEIETELINLCPGGPNADGFYSIMLNANSLTNTSYIYQTVDVTPGTTYALSGVWAVMARGRADGRWVKMKAHIQLLDGADPVNSPVLKDRFVICGDRKSFVLFPWDSFTPLVATPTGSQLTVKFYAEQMVPKTWSHLEAIAVDDLMLAEETECVLQPELAPPTDDSGTAVGVISAMTGDRSVPRDSTQTLTITGSNFTPGQMTVNLRKAGSDDIVGAVTASTETGITADFVLPADMALGAWDLVVTGPACAPAVSNGALEVYLPAFSNGSFESPVTTPCTPTRTPDYPTDWLADESGHWRHDKVWGDLYPAPGVTPDLRQNFLNLNGYTIGTSPLGWTPTCPADGSNYGTMARLTPGIDDTRSALAFQTFSVTPGQSYTFGGLFAWKTGAAVARMGLLNGDSGVMISHLTINPTNNRILLNTVNQTPPTGLSDWQFAYYSAPASKPRMTAFFFCEQKDKTSTEISLHADALFVKPCVDSFTLSSPMIPAEGEAGKIVQITSIPGSGFVSSPELPVVMLVGPAVAVGTNVQVVGGTSIRCHFDLTNAPVGTYSVIVMQQGCVDDVALKDAFQVVAPYAVQLEGISPASATNDGLLEATLSGASLEGLTGIKLVRDTGGAEIVGTLGDAGENQTERTATFDLDGAEMGRYNVVPLAVGGATPLHRAFLVVVPTPGNLSFETGTNPSEPPHGPCSGGSYDLSRPLHWDTVPADTAWYRDTRVYFSTECPPDGEHFASFTDYDDVTLKAFQTFKATRGQKVNATVLVKAKTATPGTWHITRVRLLDGDEDGTEVVVHEAASPLNWEPLEVEGLVQSGLATLSLEIDGTVNRAISHFDNVSIAVTGGCAPIAVDADHDGDVDQADFGAFQLCYTGEGGALVGTEPEYCTCFYRDADTDIDAADFAAFRLCAAGPMIPLDPANPPEGCVP